MPNSPWTETGSSISLVPSTTTIGSDPENVNYLSNQDKINLMAQYTAELAVKTSLDTLASTWSVSSSAYNTAVSNISSTLITAGAPSNWATIWPDGTTSGLWPGIQTSLANLWAQIATQRTALQSVISNAQAAAAEVAAVATAATAAASLYATTISAPSVVSTLPTLPNASYPVGKIVWNDADGQLYVNTAGTWDVLNVSTTNLFGSITAGQIAAGAIGVNQLAAGAITAASLTVCDWTNLCYNPGFELGMTSWSSSSTLSAPSTAQFRSGAQSLLLPNGSGGYRILNSNNVPCAAGQVFLLQVWAMADAALTSGTVGIRPQFYNAAGTLLSEPQYNFTPATSWAQYSFTATAPAGATSVKCAIVSTSPVGGNVYVDDCYFRRCDDASLIVDGSITSSKIATGAITADMITTGTLNAANVAVTNLNASNITTGTLSATKVLFADGTALTTASRVLTAIASETATATSVIASPGTPIPGLTFSSNAASSADTFNFYGSMSGAQTVGTAGDGCYVNLCVDGAYVQGALLTYPTIGGTISSSFVMSLTGLSAGAHTFKFYLQKTNSADTFQSYIGSTVLCQRIY